MNSSASPNEPKPEQENLEQFEDREVVRVFTFARTFLLVAVFTSVAFLGWIAHVTNKGTDEMIASLSSEVSPPAEGPGQSMILPDTFRVTSISPREPHTAIVNGQSVSEGSAVRIKTANGVIAARVTKINDDEVEMKCAGEIIAVRLPTVDVR